MSFCCVLFCISLDYAKFKKALKALRKENESKLRGKFGKLLIYTCKKLEAKVSSRDFRTFAKGALWPARSIPNSSRVRDIFDAITDNGYWNYLHCSTLIQLLEDCRIQDKRTKRKLFDYQQSLDFYALTTKIVDWIEQRSKIPLEELSPHNHSKITVEIHSDEITDESLQYVRNLWKSVAKVVLYMPNLDAVLHDMKIKCISITWLIPASDEIEKWIRKRAPLCQDLFKEHNIVLFMLNDECIYKVQTFIHLHVYYWEKRKREC